MKKKLVAVFAHPDDEAFGAGGTINKLSSEFDIYLLCATRGEAGMGGGSDLAQRREEELRKSAAILGVKEVNFLGFIDGTLSNSLYHDLAGKIEEHLIRLKPEVIMTFEPLGISGHIDHITVSLATSFVFKKLKFIKELRYVCVCEDVRDLETEEYFIYYPPGYKREEIDETVDVSDVWDKKVEAMRAHQSQSEDVKRALKSRRHKSKQEYFLILKH